MENLQSLNCGYLVAVKAKAKAGRRFNKAWKGAHVIVSSGHGTRAPAPMPTPNS